MRKYEKKKITNYNYIIIRQQNLQWKYNEKAATTLMTARGRIYCCYTHNLKNI